ncbi:dihydrofolate reductase family protein, partial [Kibdelosporangium lantanae]
KDREARGLPANPLRVTLTSSGDIDPEAQFFVDDNYVVYQGKPLSTVVEDLHGRGVRRLMVEGGTSIHTAFLTEGLADELLLAVGLLLVIVGTGRPGHAASA